LAQQVVEGADMAAAKAGNGAFRVVAELAVTSVPAAVAKLAAEFGFAADGTRLTRGDQVIALVPGQPGRSHGMIDHVALKAVDTDAASAAARRRGAVIDRGVTPDGPMEIAAFWENGVRYQFFEGPEGARLEFCAKRGVALPQDVGLDDALPGHDHIGMCCRDIEASVQFYQALGFGVVFATTLTPADGPLPVRFMAREGQVLELYSPAARRSGALVLPAQGHWCGLRLEGAGRSATLQGPDGESVTLI
jgi:catechol 2,3-dioxygenase-like lactoylglutathione lyase family enzyme